MRSGWVLGLGLGGCAVGGGEAVWDFEGVTAIEAHLGSGEMEVRTSPDAWSVVHWEGGGIGPVASPDVAVDRDGLLRVDARGGLGGGELALEVPAGAPLFLTVARGELDVALDAPASVEACVAAGELSLGLPAGAYRIALDVAAGAWEQEGLRHDEDSPFVISGCVGAGDLSLYVTGGEPGPVD